MSIINFICDDTEKPRLKSGVWSIIKKHYRESVAHADGRQYEYEEEEVYLERLDSLMTSELCKCIDTDNGLSFEFDSTENAGFSISWALFKSGGYIDYGLTSVDDIFKAIVEQFPNICFTADIDAWNEWETICGSYTYDGNNLIADLDGEY